MDPVLLDRARALARGPGRHILGIAGAPGAGKSRIAEALAVGIGERAVVVPMDGFHLHDDELARTGLADRKGAPETFDVDGYTAMLRRLRESTDRTVYAPAFDRSRELAVAAAIPVRPWHTLVVTEGNYLLYDAPGWSAVFPLLDEIWFVETDNAVRRQRLLRRHVDHGRAPETARRWVEGSDQANAVLVERTRAAADLVIPND